MMAGKIQEKQSTDWSALIARHPLFDAIDAEEREFLLSDKASQKHVLKAGKVILKQNETGYSVFVICEGAVSVTLEGSDGKSIKLYTLTDGEIFGEMAILGRRLRTATLVTTEPSKLLEIAGDEFLALMKKHHEITLYLLATLSRRLRHTDDMILTRRIPKIDNSLAELKTQLDVIAQTTDAKLAATQTMFDQTSKRAGEIIDSAGRARTRMTWLVSLAGALVSLFLGAGYLNFERVQRQIEESQNKIETSQTVVEEKEKAVKKSAADAELAKVEAQKSADGAGSSASTAKNYVEEAEVAAGKLAETSRKALANFSEIQRLEEEVRTTKALIDLTYNDGILRRFMSRVAENSFSVDAIEDYFKCINADQPKIRERLVNFLHAEISDHHKNVAILGMLEGSLTKHESEMSDNAQVATYYFMTLISILENNSKQAETNKKKIERRSQGGRAYFADIFGAGFDLNTFITILTLQENDPDLQQRQQEALKQLYGTLKQST